MGGEALCLLIINPVTITITVMNTVMITVTQHFLLVFKGRVLCALALVDQ